MTTDFGVVIPTCAKFEKVLETRSFMDQFESDREYVKSRLSKLNVSLNVECGMFNMGARAGFNRTKNASSDSSMAEYSFLYEERVFELKMANFKEYIKKGIEFTSDFVSSVNELPESYDKDDPANASKFERFFNRFGHFIVTAAYGGGSIETKVISQQHGSDAITFEEVKACLSASFSGGLLSAGGEISGSDSHSMEAKSKTILSQSTVHWYGGSRNLHANDTITHPDKMSKWKLSLGENPTMLTTEMCLEPISTAISCLDPKKDTASYDALKDLLGGQFEFLAHKEKGEEEEWKQIVIAKTRQEAVQPPDPPSDKCFPANTIVYIKDVNGNVKKKQMGDLSIGDRVQPCDTKTRRVIYSEVIMFAHRDPSVKQVKAFFHGLIKISAQNVAHLGLLPMRVLHKFRVQWVGQSAGKDEFVHPYIRWLCKLKLPWMDGKLNLPPVS